MSTFRVAQYNALARSYSMKSYFPYATHYIREDQENLDWSSRSQKLRQSIEKLDADIYCLCEIDEPEIFKLASHDSVYQQRPKRPDGCLVMWRRSVFTLVGNCHVEFPKTDRLAVAVELQHVVSGQNFRVIGTHLFWDKTSDLQVKEAGLLRDFIRTLSPMPTILAGDLNNTRGSETFNTVGSALVDLQDIFTIQNAPPPAFTSVVPGANGRKEEIDFIFATRSEFLVTNAGVFVEGEITDGIPNALHGSDHLPVFADLRLNRSSLSS